MPASSTLLAEGPSHSDDGPGSLPLIGGMIALALFVSLVGWAAVMQIASAAIAAGTVTVEGNRKAIQHRDGGPVETVFVREGEFVKKGQPLLTLDLSDTRAKASVLLGDKLQNLARRARLEAEVSDSTELRFSPQLVSQTSQDPHSLTLMEREREPIHARRQAYSGAVTLLARSMTFMKQEQELFNAKYQAYIGAVSLLGQEITGAKEQIRSLEGNSKATEKQFNLVHEELEALQPLFDRGLVTKPRILALSRLGAELEAKLETIGAALAEQRNRISQAEINVEQLKRERHETANDELSEVNARLAEIVPLLRAAHEQLGRGTLVAPEDGYVLNLGVFGSGSAIVPGQTIMEIVPADDTLVLTVEIRPSDIDTVSVGQPVLVHLLSYEQRYELQIHGKLTKISSDEIVDPARQISFFRGTVAVNPDDLAASGAHLVPGMPVEAMIQTGERTIMDYLLDPAFRMYRYAFRES